MKKRILAVLLVLAMALTPTALAAEEEIYIFTKDGPVWLAQRNAAESWELVYSANKGKTWTATNINSSGWPIQDIQYTGRDYFLTGYRCKGANISTDGINWNYLSNAYWFEENAEHITSGLSWGKYQLIWTGTEYMMQQSIKGEPRSTHPSMGDSPRNKAVTFLDENYEIIGGMAFDGEVESIRYKNKTYYATVGGVEHSFTRADWENSFEGPGIINTDFHSDATVILRREVNQLSRGRVMCSYDGVSWQVVPSQEAQEDGLSYNISPGKNMNDLLVSTGRGFFNVGGSTRDWRATTDGIHWMNIGDKDWVAECAKGWTNLSANGSHDLQLVWTGTNYLLCQNIWTGAPETRVFSPGNTKVTFLDENYNLVKQYDFGRQVHEVGYGEGTYYAKVETTDLDSGFLTQTVFASQDVEKWDKTELESIPQATPGKNAPADGDKAAGEYILRLEENGDLLVSDDGVYYTIVDNIPADRSVLPIPYKLAETYAGNEGMVLRLIATYPSGNVAGEREKAYTNATLSAAIAAALPGPRYYATLDGAYISFDNPPYEKNSRMMVPLRGVSEALGFTVDYDDKGVTCTKGDTVITVEFGTSNATVNGEAYTLDAGVEVYRDRTYVPIRFFSEQMGLDVIWNGETGTAILTTNT